MQANGPSVKIENLGFKYTKLRTSAKTTGTSNAIVALLNLRVRNMFFFANNT